MQFFGGKGGAVDAVLADAPARHHDHITDFSLFFVPLARFSLSCPRHFAREQAHGAAVHQGFAEEAFVKDD